MNTIKNFRKIILILFIPIMVNSEPYNELSKPLFELKNSRKLIFSKSKEIALLFLDYNIESAEKNFNQLSKLLEIQSHLKLKTFIKKEVRFIKLLKKEQKFLVNADKIRFAFLNVFDCENLYHPYYNCLN